MVHPWSVQNPESLQWSSQSCSWCSRTPNRTIRGVFSCESAFLPRRSDLYHRLYQGVNAWSVSYERTRRSGLGWLRMEYLMYPGNAGTSCVRLSTHSSHKLLETTYITREDPFACRGLVEGDVVYFDLGLEMAELRFATSHSRPTTVRMRHRSVESRRERTRVEGYFCT